MIVEHSDFLPTYYYIVTMDKNHISEGAETSKDGLTTLTITKELLELTHNPYILVIKGNSMKPMLQPGDTVVFEFDAEPENGDVISCHYQNKVLITQYYETDFGIKLEPVNKDYESYFIQNESELQILGVAISYNRKLKNKVS